METYAKSWSWILFLFHAQFKSCLTISSSHVDIFVDSTWELFSLLTCHTKSSEYISTYGSTASIKLAHVCVSSTAAIAGKCQVTELQAEGIDRHTEGDSLILRTVRAQPAGPVSPSYTVSTKHLSRLAHRVCVCVCVMGSVTGWMDGWIEGCENDSTRRKERVWRCYFCGVFANLGVLSIIHIIL